MPRSLPITPRGLRRIDAAAYVGVSPSKFDEWVLDGRMPAGKAVDGCVLWDIRALDAYFDAILYGDTVDKKQRFGAPQL